MDWILPIDSNCQIALFVFVLALFLMQLLKQLKELMKL